ncbi:MAG: transporter [Desulfobacteraceae bacterium]|jgi:hypothetical protein
MKRICIAIVFGICLGLPFVSIAGETNARDYIPAPPGTDLMLTYAKSITADSVYVDGERVSGFNYTQSLGFFRWVHFSTLFGMPIDYQAILFYNSEKLDGAAVGGAQLSSSGVMDPLFVSTIWPISKPETKTWLGFTQYVSVPFGEYEENEVLNPGLNRWSFKEELGFVQGIGDKMYFEIQPSVEFFTDNDDYLGADLEKDPLYQVQVHLSYDIVPKFWIAGDYTYQFGGETKVNGVSQDDEITSHKLGLSFNYVLSEETQVLVDYSKVVDTENGPDVGIAGVRFLFIF